MGGGMKDVLVGGGGMVFSALVLQLMSSQAQAALTYINPVGGGNGSERCLVSTAASCAGGTYNGGLSIITVLENDIGMGSFTRVDDEFDRLWANTVNRGGQVLALARYASDTNRLGYDVGGGYKFLSNSVANNKVLVTDTSSYAGDPHRNTLRDDFFMDSTPNWKTIPLTADTPFAFILRDVTKNPDVFWSSNNGTSGVASTGYANSTNREDHMVAFRVNDSSTPHYIIAWDDRALSSSDKDYNDFVAELKFVMPVPVPAALVLLGPALLGLGGFTRRRRS